MRRSISAIVAHPAVASLPLRDLAFRIVTPAAWAGRLAGASWEALAAEPWVMTPPISTHHALATELFAAHGIAPSRRVEADHEAVISSLVAGGPRRRADARGPGRRRRHGGHRDLGRHAHRDALAFVYRRERERRSGDPRVARRRRRRLGDVRDDAASRVSAGADRGRRRPACAIMQVIDRSCDIDADAAALHGTITTRPRPMVDRSRPGARSMNRRLLLQGFAAALLLRRRHRARPDSPRSAAPKDGERRGPAAQLEGAAGEDAKVATDASRRSSSRTTNGGRRSIRRPTTVLRHEGTERPFTSPLNDEHRAGRVRLRRLRAAAVHVRDEVRQRHGLAELFHDDSRRVRDRRPTTS